MANQGGEGAVDRARLCRLLQQLFSDPGEVEIWACSLVDQVEALAGLPSAVQWQRSMDHVAFELSRKLEDRGALGNSAVIAAMRSSLIQSHSLRAQAIAEVFGAGPGVVGGGAGPAVRRHFFDDHPYDLGRPEARDLRDLLVGAYGQVPDIRRVLEEAGVRIAQVTLQGSALAIWESALRVAAEQQRIRDVVDRARQMSALQRKLDDIEARGWRDDAEEGGEDREDASMEIVEATTRGPGPVEVGRFTGGSVEPIGAGTAIAPHWVLTARRMLHPPGVIKVRPVGTGAWRSAMVVPPGDDAPDVCLLAVNSALPEPHAELCADEVELLPTLPKSALPGQGIFANGRLVGVVSSGPAGQLTPVAPLTQAPWLRSALGGIEGELAALVEAVGRALRGHSHVVAVLAEQLEVSTTEVVETLVQTDAHSVVRALGAVADVVPDAHRTVHELLDRLLPLAVNWRATLTSARAQLAQEHKTCVLTLHHQTIAGIVLAEACGQICRFRPLGDPRGILHGTGFVEWPDTLFEAALCPDPAPFRDAVVQHLAVVLRLDPEDPHVLDEVRDQLWAEASPPRRNQRYLLVIDHDHQTRADMLWQVAYDALVGEDGLPELSLVRLAGERSSVESRVAKLLAKLHHRIPRDPT